MRRSLLQLGRATGLLAALAQLVACDPIRVVSGQVRSVPPARAPKSVEAGPLAGAVVGVTCGERAGTAFPDPDAGRHVLAITRRDGTFDYASAGYWDRSCVLDIASGDGTHDVKRVSIPELCKRTTGSESCLEIEGVTFNLVRRRESAPPLAVNLVSTPEGLELVADEELACKAPCSTLLTAGLHRLALRPPGREHHYVWAEQVDLREAVDVKVDYELFEARQEAALWFTLPAVVGLYMVPFGLWKKNEAVAWTGAGLLVGGGLGFVLVWKSDRVDVQVQAAR